jgi:hypothetical protein
MGIGKAGALIFMMFQQSTYGTLYTFVVIDYKYMRHRILHLFALAQNTTISPGQSWSYESDYVAPAE